MTIYISHSSSFNYQTELYAPLKRSELARSNNLIFPKDTAIRPENIPGIIEKAHLVVAEVSYPSKEQGAELGWASRYQVPIVCIYKKGQKISNSLNIIAKHFVEYENSRTLADTLQKYLQTKL